MAESRNSAVLSKIRAYLNKWRPIRNGLPIVIGELEKLGMARGPKFDDVVEQVFAAQLTGRGKTPEEREKILRKLSGIKEPPKKKEKEKKPAKAGGKPGIPPETTAAAGHAAQAEAAKAAQKQHHKERLGAGKHGAKHSAPASHAKSGSSGKRSRGHK
jgi:hypothetical protein